MSNEKNEMHVGKRWLKLRTVLKYYEIEGVEGKVEKIEKYAEMISSRRAWAGLTSRSLRNNMEQAILGSLTVFSAANCGKMAVVEIGSGGGLLGIVVSIICPEWSVTMTERSGRKSAFLAEAVGSLGIANAEVFHGEAQRLAGEREFDLCISRASGRLVEVAPIAIALLRPGGKYIAIKQTGIEGELEEARGVIEVNGGRLPGGGIATCEPEVQVGGVALVVIEKS